MTSNGTECFWPPAFKESLFKKGPGQNWKAETIVLRGTYNDYDKARKLLPRAENSNLESDDNAGQVRKRNPGKPVRYQTTDSEDVVSPAKKKKSAAALPKELPLSSRASTSKRVKTLVPAAPSVPKPQLPAKVCNPPAPPGPGLHTLHLTKPGSERRQPHMDQSVVPKQQFITKGPLKFLPAAAKPANTVTTRS